MDFRPPIRHWNRAPQVHYNRELIREGSERTHSLWKLSQIPVLDKVRTLIFYRKLETRDQAFDMRAREGVFSIKVLHHIRVSYVSLSILLIQEASTGTGSIQATSRKSTELWHINQSQTRRAACFRRRVIKIYLKNTIHTYLWFIVISL